MLFTVEERTVMTSIRPIVGLVVAALLGACGPGLQAQERPLANAGTVAATTETPVVSGPADPGTPVDTTEPDIGGVDRSQASTSTTSTAQAVTTTTEASPVGEAQQATTTPMSDEAIDIQAVVDALDALDALFGDFDSEVGAIDLDEEEGVTP